MTLRIREATAADHPSYVRLFAELGIDDSPARAEKFAEELAPSTLLAEREGEVAGYAYWRMMDGNAHLAHLVCAPAARRTGAGRALITEVIRRARAAGATEIALSVQPKNTAAVALYSSFGFVAKDTRTHVRIDWAAVERAATPYHKEVARFEPSQDTTFEQRFDLPAGIFSSLRARRDYVLLAIGDRAGTAFDPTFPGAYPFCAIDGAHAFSLLAALRPYAREADTMLNLSLATTEEATEALFAGGATLRFQTTRMVCPIL